MPTFFRYIAFMANGGRRKGAGRKIGSTGLLTAELREKIDGKQLISFLEGVVDGKVEGATLANRVMAATTLLRKVIPDCKQLDFETAIEPVIVVKSHIPPFFDE